MVEPGDDQDSDSETDVFADAVDLDDLRRRYAGVLAAAPLAEAYDLQDTRATYVRKRQALKKRRALAPADVASLDTWLRAYIAGSAAREVLAQGLEHLPPNLRGRHHALLDHYAEWTVARHDPAIPRDFLRQVALEFRPGSTPPPRRTEAEFARAALAVRRRYPALVALAPTLFRHLLQPTYKTAEVQLARRGAAQAAPTASPTSRRRRTRTPTASSPTWVWFLIAVMAMGVLRACRGPRFSGHAEVDNELRNIQRRFDDIEERSRERLKRWEQDDDLPRGGR